MPLTCRRHVQSLPVAAFVAFALSGCGAPGHSLATAPAPPAAIAAQAPPAATASTFEALRVDELPAPVGTEAVPSEAMLAGVARMQGDGVGHASGAGAPEDLKPLSPHASAVMATLFGAVRSGNRTLMPGRLPAYVPLAPAELASARLAGQGRTLAQLSLNNEPHSSRRSEPVEIVVHGSRGALEASLVRSGWIKANSRSAWNFIKMGASVMTRLWNERGAPVSPMYLEGQLEAFAYEKNSDYVLARDHMRIYDRGVDPVSGEATWFIAASRDVAASVTFHRPGISGFKPSHWKLNPPSFGHDTDHDCDGERDLIMQSLLDAHSVTRWAAVTAVWPGQVPGERDANGRIAVGTYRTDGLIYEAWLSH